MIIRGNTCKGQKSVRHFILPPRRLKLEHTNYCNSQCIMCSHYFTDNANSQMVNDIHIKRILPVLPHVRRILLQGSGEPLAHPHIAEYIEKYAEMGIDVTCNTNLSIMNPRLVAAINKGFKKISVSCDGCTAEIFEGIRQGLKFDKFTENLRHLRTACPTLCIKMYVVLLRQNIRQLPDIIRYASEMGCNSIVITDLNPKEILDNKRDMVRNYPTVTKRHLQEAILIADSLNIRLQYPVYLMELQNGNSYEEEVERMNSSPLFPDKEFQVKLQDFYKSLHLEKNSIRADLNSLVVDSGYHCTGICNYLMEEPFIDLNGDVFPCSDNGRYNIGNIYEQEFMDIWNNEYYMGLRGLFMNGKIPQYCKGCLYLRNHYLEDVKVLDMDDSFFDQQANIDMVNLSKRFKEFCKRQE